MIECRFILRPSRREHIPGLTAAKSAFGVDVYVLTKMTNSGCGSNDIDAKNRKCKMQNANANANAKGKSYKT